MATVPLADGTCASLYALQTKDGMHLYAVLLHPCMAEPWYFEKTNTSTGETATFEKNGHTIEYVKKKYGPWKRIASIPSVDGYLTVKADFVSNAMLEWWHDEKTGAVSVGLDGKHEPDAREFQALPMMLMTSLAPSEPVERLAQAGSRAARDGRPRHRQVADLTGGTGAAVVQPPTQHEVLEWLATLDSAGLLQCDRLPDLQAHRFLLREQGSGTRMAVDEHFKAKGFTPQLRLELGSNEALKHAVGAGLGLGLVQQVHGGAEGLATRQAAHGPADVLARSAHAGIFAIQAVVVIQVFEQPGLGLRDLGGG